MADPKLIPTVSTLSSSVLALQKSDSQPTPHSSRPRISLPLLTVGGDRVIPKLPKKKESPSCCNAADKLKTELVLFNEAKIFVEAGKKQ